MIPLLLILLVKHVIYGPATQSYAPFLSAADIVISSCYGYPPSSPDGRMGFRRQSAGTEIRMSLFSNDMIPQCIRP